MRVENSSTDGLLRPQSRRSISSCQIGLRWSSAVAGGAERVFADLAASLPAEGVRFLGAVTGPPGLAEETRGLVRSFAPEDASILQRLRGARSTLGLLLNTERPEVLASHFAMYTLPILDRLRERPFVMHFHGPWAMESGVEGGSAAAVFAKHQAEAAVYRRADCAIVLSEAFATLLHEQYGVDRERIRVVPGAVDLERFTAMPDRATARELLSWPNDRPILFSVRRLVQRMGLVQLIEALPVVLKAVPDLLCCLAGTGPLRSQLETRVRELGIASSVRFLGFLRDDLLPSAYRAADLSVVPTLALEGFGLVAAESLAAGTPVLVTPIGGLPEVVGELSPALIFRSSSSADLADGITAALLGRVHVPDAQECRAYAERKFSRHRLGAEVAAIYRDLVAS